MGNAFGREDDLPQLVSPGAESAGKGQKIKFPHTVETITVFIFENIPAVLEILKPVHQGFIIIGAEVMPVFKDE